MANLTSVKVAISKAEVAERAAQKAVDRYNAANRELVCQLRDVRLQAGLSLRATAKELSCSAGMLYDLETGRRWSEGIVMRYQDLALRLTGHATRRDGPAPEQDDGCPFGDPSCTSVDGECHDACEAAP